LKFTFVLPDITRIRSAHCNFAIGAPSVVLKEAGQKTSLLHYVKPVKEKHPVKSVLEESPNIVGFTATTNMFGDVNRMAISLKRHFDFPLICGGVHPTLAPKSSINTNGIDMICVGEAKGALSDLCYRMEIGTDITSIPNVWIGKDGKVFSDPPRALVENLDSLPFQDQDIFDYENLAESINRPAKVMASWGCPHNCTYCCNFQIKEIYRKEIDGLFVYRYYIRG